MSLTVYAFNDAYPLYLHLMGLRSFFSSPEWTSMVFLTVSLVTLIGVLTVQQRSVIGYGKAYAMPVLLYALLFIPTARLKIEDQWSRDAYSVDKVPVALALPLAATTILEKNIVDLVDKHIVPANVPSFAQFDFFLEAMALSEVLNGKTIHNYETLSSVGRYFDDCILKGIATGFVNESAYYRSGKLLIDSYMPWNIYFTEVTHPDGRKEVMTCKMAYNRLFGSVAGEANSVGPAGMAAYLSNLFGGRHQSIADTLTAMNGLANAMFPGHQATSEALFQQAFMINGLQSSLTKSNPQLLAAISQAEVAQSTGIAAAASVYIKKLPKLRAMIKLTIIGLLPLVGGFFLAQCGRPLVHWALALLSVSLWLPNHQGVLHQLGHQRTAWYGTGNGRHDPAQQAPADELDHGYQYNGGYPRFRHPGHHGHRPANSGSAPGAFRGKHRGHDPGHGRVFPAFGHAGAAGRGTERQGTGNGQGERLLSRSRRQPSVPQPADERTDGRSP